MVLPRGIEEDSDEASEPDDHDADSAEDNPHINTDPSIHHPERHFQSEEIKQRIIHVLEGQNPPPRCVPRLSRITWSFELYV